MHNVLRVLKELPQSLPNRSFPRRERIPICRNMRIVLSALKGLAQSFSMKYFAWLKDPSCARIFWLSGIAGSGKSAIAQSTSIRAALLADHIVVSIFFSQFGYARPYEPSSVFQTIAFQFSLLDVGYKERLSDVINEHPDIFEKDLRFQYEKLIIDTLGAIRRAHNCILITLDGLDECEPHGATSFCRFCWLKTSITPRKSKISPQVVPRLICVTSSTPKETFRAKPGRRRDEERYSALSPDSL
ncbi:hypothetical protein EI94DRAFT_98631 [Lactarius quietus]|nr:hypothetical protein EI94DRAFT_98631 [Lactarius quietus]